MPSQRMQSMARQIAEDLGLRLSALTLATSNDGSGNPTVSLGALTAGSQSAFILCKEQASIQVDSLGLAQRSFGPNVIQLVLETSTIANVPLMTVANYVKLLGTLLRHGVKLELYLTANATPVSVSGITGAPAVTFDNLWQPLTASM
jgi:hypothetical protein